MEFSTLVQFSKLVTDSATSEDVFSLLATTVVEQCHALHGLVLGATEAGNFKVLSSHGARRIQLEKLELSDVYSLGEVETAIAKACRDFNCRFRILPLIGEARLFGALVVIYPESEPLTDVQWQLAEGLAELTGISLNKTFQHQKLQKAYDDLRRSQNTLVRSEKFRALGQMSAGIAHDLKNILNPLLLYADMLRDSAGKSGEVLDISERIERILTRGLQTVERLRDFSRQSSEDADAVPTDINAIIGEALEICKPRLGATELVLELGDPPMALMRPSDCVTAIVNLVFNALDALGGKGVIRVRSGASNGGGWIEISDNGPGIPPEIRSRIAEPFFTTKGEMGTGLGISIVDAFVQRHGGRLEIESEPGRGATFRMWFPAIQERAAQQSRSS